MHSDRFSLRVGHDKCMYRSRVDFDEVEFLCCVMAHPSSQCRNSNEHCIITTCVSIVHFVPMNIPSNDTMFISSRVVVIGTDFDVCIFSVISSVTFTEVPESSIIFVGTMLSCTRNILCCSHVSSVVRVDVPQIVNQLANIFNKSFLTGIVPTELKIAKVIPLYKTKDPALFCNYRPISLLPVFSKILERLMYNRLYNFLTEHNILSMNQFGFRKKYSTFLALMDLVDNITKNIDGGNYSIGIFLDLSKAFDTIDHTILSDNFRRYGIVIVCIIVG